MGLTCGLLFVASAAMVAGTICRFDAFSDLRVQHVTILAFASRMADCWRKVFVGVHVLAGDRFHVLAGGELEIPAIYTLQQNPKASYLKATDRELSHLAFKSLALGNTWISWTVANLHFQRPLKQVHNSMPCGCWRISLYPAWNSRPSCWHLHCPIGMHSPESSRNIPIAYNFVSEQRVIDQIGESS